MQKKASRLQEAKDQIKLFKIGYFSFSRTIKEASPCDKAIVKK